MADSWREILESAAAMERADAKGGVHPGEAPHEAENQGGERSPSVEFHPPAASRRFGEPELAAFLTRLATPPDAGSAAQAEDGPAPPPGRQAPSRARAAGNSLVAPVGAAKPPAEAEKSAPVYTPSPVSRERPPWRGLRTSPARSQPSLKRAASGRGRPNPAACECSEPGIGEPRPHARR